MSACWVKNGGGSLYCITCNWSMIQWLIFDWLYISAQKDLMDSDLRTPSIKYLYVLNSIDDKFILKIKLYKYILDFSWVKNYLNCFNSFPLLLGRYNGFWKKLCLQKFLIFAKFQKPLKMLLNPRSFFVIVVYCSKRRCSQIEPQLKVEAP